MLFPSKEILGSDPDRVLDSVKISKNGGETLRSNELSEGQSSSSDVFHCNDGSGSDVLKESNKPKEKLINVNFFVKSLLKKRLPKRLLYDHTFWKIQFIAGYKYFTWV